MKQQEDLQQINASTTYRYYAYHLFDINNILQLYLRNLSDAVHPKHRQVTLKHLGHFEPF